MKVYESNKSYDFSYPDEMKKILAYLNENGKILVNPKIIEDLYKDFSDEVYDASWMGVNNMLLE